MHDHVTAIADLIHSITNYDRSTMFTTAVECMAFAISNSVDPHGRVERESRYMAHVERYGRKIIEVFTHIFAHVVEALELEPGDVLGSVFHALELHNQHKGQYFTPYHLCGVMAKTTLGDPRTLREAITRRGFVTAHEPAVGAGAMVIALAEEMRAAQINYQQHLHVTAIDVDPRAVHMAYIQLSLLHIPAVVIVGNSLTGEYRDHFYTPAHILGGWSTKLRAHTEPHPGPQVPTATTGVPAQMASAPRIGGSPVADPPLPGLAATPRAPTPAARPPARRTPAQPAPAQLTLDF